MFHHLLAPTGALIVIMVYYISAAAAATFSDFHSVHQCNWYYICHSKSLKQYQCNWCHKSHKRMLNVACPLVHWSIGPLVHWSMGPLVHWSIGLLVHWTIGWMSKIKCQMPNVNKSWSLPPELLWSFIPLAVMCFDLHQTFTSAKVWMTLFVLA